MHVVLGLVFLKYVSDAFKERREELKAAFADPANDYYLGPDGAELIEQELEARDYYTEKNVFWVPALARWDFLKDSAKVAIGTKLEVKNGKTFEYKFTGIGRLLDDALEAVEKENPKLKNVLDKSYARWRIDEALPGLIDLLATVPFKHESLHAKDILGHVYEYFLGEFPLPPASAAASSTRPRASSRLIVEMLEPFQGRVYDPCCGSGGFFVQSEALRAGARRQDRQWQQIHLRPGSQPHHLAPGLDEHGHPRHGLRLRQGAGQHLQRPSTPTCAPTSSWPIRPST
jgi:type I restriction enzyme M protein